MGYGSETILFAHETKTQTMAHAHVRWSGRRKQTHFTVLVSVDLCFS